MARTELPNGVILPAEYSDDWYEDMTSNLTKLDDVIGSDAEKLNADGVDFLRMSSAALTDGGTGNFSDLNSSYKIKTGDLILDSGRKLYKIVSVNSTTETFTVGNSLFKVTAESDLAPVAESGDYDDLDNKPDLNPYDQHIADTDIHVTTADKATWNTVTSKANDSDVVHKSGDETVGGAKTFSSDLYVANTDTTANTPNLILRNYKADRGTTDTAVQTISFSDKNAKALAILESRRYSNGSTATNILCYNTDANNNTVSGGVTIIKSPIETNFAPNSDNTVTCGRSLSRWSKIYGTEYYYGSNNVEFSTKFVTTDTAQTISGNKTFSSINGVEPSSLSLPSYTGSRIDISSYITNLTGGNGNEYTAPANGYIFVRTTDGTYLKLAEYPSGVISSVCSQTADDIGTFLPVIAGRKCIIVIKCSSVNRAYFIPCQGNV